MLLFVFLSAILNLSIGYAIGSGFKLPEGLPKIPLLRKKKKLDDLDEEDALTRPVEESNQEAPPAEPPPAVTIRAPQPEAVAEPKAVAEAVEPPVEATPSDNTKASKEVSTEDLMAGLQNLQLQLAEVGEELMSHEDDAEEFGECASRLQVANHVYLEKANGTIDQLDELGNAGDASATEAKKSVSSGYDKAEQASQKIDNLLEGELDEAARKELLAQSAELVESAKESCNLESPKPAEQSIDPPSDSIASDSKGISVDDLFEKIENAVKQMDDGKSLFVAETRLDPPKEPISEASLLDGITTDLNALIAESINAKHTYTTEGRRLVLLEGDSLEEACQRVEEIRQKFESTTFLANSITAQATVTCAVSEINGGTTLSEIEKQLITAAEEAEQIGVNRTFHHDGAFATAISPLELSIEKRVVEI